jgi:O-acetyl-ADP-ribose deacetylase (regulator of RNase III)
MKTVKGDLLALAKEGKFDIIVQGCNCHNVMGAGIARQIRDEFPDAWLADQQTLKGDKNKLGHYSMGIGGRLVIINAYTQYNTASRAGEDVFDYHACYEVLQKLSERFGKWRIGLPMIGMGLAGGDPVRIMAMLEDFAARMDAQGGSATLVEYVKS